MLKMNNAIAAGQLLSLLFLLGFTRLIYAENNTPYVINAGDILEISVWNEENLHKELQVLPDGSISFPLAGVLNIAGKSVNTARSELREKLLEFISDPEVNISVKSVEGNIVYVIGQVNNPGNFIMHQQMDVMQILSLAGGLTSFAKSNDIVILRRDKAGSETIKFEYGTVEDGDNLEKNVLVKSGDVIVVP